MNKQMTQIVFASGHSVDVIFVGNKQLLSSTRYNSDPNYSKPLPKIWYEEALNNSK